MTTNREDDPGYWRSRAAETQEVAGQLYILESKRKVLEVAAGYEYLAGAGRTATTEL